jgi:hypothetical protein
MRKGFCNLCKRDINLVELTPFSDEVLYETHGQDGFRCNNSWKTYREGADDILKNLRGVIVPPTAREILIKLINEKLYEEKYDEALTLVEALRCIR